MIAAVSEGIVKYHARELTDLKMERTTMLSVFGYQSSQYPPYMKHPQMQIAYAPSTVANSGTGG